MVQRDVFYRFGVALALGILVGLQREYAYARPEQENFAGVRTFALMGLLGCLAAMVSDILGSGLAFAVILGTMGIWILTAYYLTARDGDVGLTTEMAILVTTGAGALCYWNYLPLAVAIAVTTTLLLSLKLELHRFAHIITREDIFATLKFAVITAIILPVLPQEAVGPPPFDVLKPYNVWLMVVLISGISFAGYVLIKIAGPRQGIGLTGLLGGLASSTAVTLSLTERSSQRTQLGRPLALAIMMAWTVMFGRMLVEVGVVDRSLLAQLWLPATASALVGLLYCAYLYLAQRPEDKEQLVFSNPFELGTALKFGAIYATVLLVSRIAQMYLGEAGIYLSSVAGGLADVDAIALSVARLHAAAGGPSTETAAQAIMLAAASNTAAKGAIVLAGGSPALRKALWPGFLLMLATGLGVAFLL